MKTLLIVAAVAGAAAAAFLLSTFREETEVEEATGTESYAYNAMG